jgi:hypothetical protein
MLQPLLQRFDKYIFVADKVEVGSDQLACPFKGADWKAKDLPPPLHFKAGLKRPVSPPLQCCST